MKKLLTLGIVVTLLLIIPTFALGLTSPAVSEGHGVITGMFVTPDGVFSLGAEYGLSPQFAVLGNVGFTEETSYKLGVKYELNPNLALVGGVADPDSSFFLGVNAGTAFGKKFYGMAEVDLKLVGEDLIFLYEAGAKYSLSNQLDIRGGVVGTTQEGDEVGFELGVGFKF